MFCHITQNWRGRPLVSHEVIINLIANTSPQQGLRIQAELDQAKYPLKIKVTDDELQTVQIKRHKFHGEWNYTIRQINCSSHSDASPKHDGSTPAARKQPGCFA